jgi:hypothetical protein
MTSGNDPLEPSLDFPPIVRPETSPMPSNPRLPVPRLPGNLPLSTIALASGIALAFEGLRLAARSTRKRASAGNVAETSALVTVSYEWTQFIYERRERP